MNTKYDNLIFIHGLEGNPHGTKATLLRGLFPDMVIPEFAGSLDTRMVHLREILAARKDWYIIGSSFGGLMAALYACRYPEKVRKLVLLAPALIWPDFAADLPPAVSIPVVIYHGQQDEIIPIAFVKELAQQVFQNLIFHEVEDDHGLHKTIHNIDWLDVLFE